MVGLLCSVGIDKCRKRVVAFESPHACLNGLRTPGVNVMVAGRVSSKEIALSIQRCFGVTKGRRCPDGFTPNLVHA